VVGPFAIVAPLGIWLAYKDKSRLVKNQSMQALLYQAVISIIGVGVVIMVFMFSIVTFGLGFILFLPLMLVGLIFMIYPLYGAYMCYEKKGFKYVLIGDFVEKKM
jgi:uncharacterized protein